MNLELAPVLGDVLVVGTYPPIPGHASVVTLAAVRRAYAAGQEVVVASPRPGAAHRTVRLDGPDIDARLDQVRLEHETRRLVVCAEPGMPIPLASSEFGPRVRVEMLLHSFAVRQVDTVAALGRAMDRFDHVTVVVTGDLGVAPEVLGGLWDHVDEVLFDGEPDVDRVWLAGQLGLDPKRLVDVVGVAEPAGSPGSPGGSLEAGGGGAGVASAEDDLAAHPEVGILHRALTARLASQAEAGRPPGVTLFGPPEIVLRERPRQVVSMTARAVLGPAAPLVRRGVAKAVKTARHRRA
jgi:hypothetical protein